MWKEKLMEAMRAAREDAAFIAQKEEQEKDAKVVAVRELAGKVEGALFAYQASRDDPLFSGVVDAFEVDDPEQEFSVASESGGEVPDMVILMPEGSSGFAFMADGGIAGVSVEDGQLSVSRTDDIYGVLSRIGNDGYVERVCGQVSRFADSVIGAMEAVAAGLRSRREEMEDPEPELAVEPEDDSVSGESAEEPEGDGAASVVSEEEPVVENSVENVDNPDDEPQDDLQRHERERPVDPPVFEEPEVDVGDDRQEEVGHDGEDVPEEESAGQPHGDPQPVQEEEMVLSPEDSDGIQDDFSDIASHENPARGQSEEEYQTAWENVAEQDAAGGVQTVESSKLPEPPSVNEAKQFRCVMSVERTATGAVVRIPPEAVDKKSLGGAMASIWLVDSPEDTSPKSYYMVDRHKQFRMRNGHHEVVLLNHQTVTVYGMDGRKQSISAPNLIELYEVMAVVYDS